MDEPTCAPLPNHGISDIRHELATMATYEIGAVAGALREFIERNDSSNEVRPVARGMLARIQRLSDAIAECIGNGDDWDDAALREIVVHASR